MLLYNAMSLISTSLSGDAYLNYLFSGIIEIPAYTFIPILINRFVVFLNSNLIVFLEWVVKNL